MQYAIIAVILILIVMIVVMSIILKKTVRIVNEQSKNYFLSKLQSYDDIILEKENKLKEVNEQISSIKNDRISEEKKEEDIDTDYYYPDDIPNYQEESFMEKYKKIDQLFSFDNKKIIINFLENNKEIDDNRYSIYIRIREKLDFELVYELEISSQEEQVKELEKIFDKQEKEILLDYLNRENDGFDIIDFQGYIDKLINLNDPTIYVWVGNKKENYDYLDKRIKTEYDKNILKGISIIYQNKIYDYTLS